MKLNAKFFALFLGVFSLMSLAHAADTLEVFVLRVQFKKESPDNSLTTGTGVFGSDTGTYNLDPSESRGNKYYWQKHLNFASAYYKAASGGELIIKDSILPTVYTLDKQMIDYNRTQKMKGEKTAEYDSARSCDYLRFVYDAVMAAHKSENGSPFNIPLSKNPNTKRAFMIAHAGSSSLLDGGSMGTKGANTPGDFFDVYISRNEWVFLPDTLPGVVIAKDSVNNGIVLKGAAVDTIKSMMVVSETASQDGLNWGINGIVVNQIGRELGLPNTFDDVKGTSRLGYFDIMDFAGYNAGNGFFPVLPAAWERAYMGWSNVKEVRPTAGHPVTVDIAAAGSGLGTEIVKVPLSASEYILIENRQRSWNKDGSVKVYLGEAKQNNDTTFKSILVDSLYTVFEDSICNDGKCKRNEKKASGLVLGVNSFDAGLPASGIAVWKVNDWYLRESLRYGSANQWGGEFNRDHQFGLTLVESDNVLSIGKMFKNAIGEDTQDYGSGADLLPHLRYAKDKKFDTVKTILPTGYANTATTQGGYTGFKISVEIPKDARVEKTANAFMGDSVINFAAPVIRVTISVDDGSIENSKFPKNVGLASAVRGAVFVNYEDESTGKAVVFASEDGTLQALNALGDTLFVSDTSVVQKQVSQKNKTVDVPLYRLGPSYGPLVGLAGDGERVYSLHKKHLVRTSFNSGVPMQDVMDLQKSVSGAPSIQSALVGPIVASSHLFFASDSGFWTVNLTDEMTRSFTSTENIAHPQDMALCKVDKQDYFAVVVGEDGKIFMRKFSLENKADAKPSFSKQNAGIAQVNASKNEKFHVACTDLNRDGTVEAVMLGSRGTVASFKLGEGGKQSAEWTHVYKRGASGTSGLYDENSGIAFGDLNGDAYPEIVFLGDNLVYALDRFGLPIDGFPVTINRGTPIYGFHSDPLVVDVTGDKIPEILVPSSDGLVYAYMGKGKRVSDRFPIAAGGFEIIDSVSQIAPMSIFVTDAVKNSKGPELYAFHRNRVTAFRLDKAADGAEKAASAWSLPAAGNERTGFFDASKLGDVDAVKSQDEISEFFIFPNPVRGGEAKVRMGLGAKPRSIKLELYDITGLCVFKKDIPDGVAGMNQANLDLHNLGSDIYTARLKVKFESGKTKQKLYRVGVVR
ncbi:M6 family metalloprotease domain-containing protein [Fibrobacter sp. UWB11]|nr:M6 family metalloprotease domain-containing protein [Fibrobacter sp. UWB11]